MIDLGLEGKMLAAAFAAAAVSAVTGSAWLGLGAGIAAGVFLALVIAFACVTHRGNQVVAAMAINIVVAGLAPTLALAWFDLGGQTPQLEGPRQRFLGIAWPWSQAARRHPMPGLAYSELLSGHNLIVYLAAVLVPTAAWVLYRTRFGLRLRAVGENPLAVDTAGISVTALRYQASILSGILCGVAGTYLSTAASAGFVRDMTAGKGYLALAALIFGKWRPYPTLCACLLFAFADAGAARLEGVALPVIGVVPVQFIIALPYILTVFLLAGFVGEAIAPKAIGVPYSKDK
jgi:simple sugar transport system permease protein